MSAAPLAGVVGLDATDLADLIAALTRLELTVACAESLTGGLLTALLTEVPGASAVVRGGLVVYATELKNTLARVDAGLLAARGPVDPDVAVALAHGARVACGASLGLGLTGVAGPDQQHGVPVGTWYVALTWDGGCRLRADRPPDRDEVAGAGAVVPPGRADIRSAAVRAAVLLLQDRAAHS